MRVRPELTFPSDHGVFEPSQCRNARSPVWPEDGTGGGALTGARTPVARRPVRRGVVHQSMPEESGWDADWSRGDDWGGKFFEEFSTTISSCRVANHRARRSPPMEDGGQIDGSIRRAWVLTVVPLVPFLQGKGPVRRNFMQRDWLPWPW